METEIQLANTIERKNGNRIWKDIKRNTLVYMGISPFFILFGIFGLFPVLFSFYASFQKWDGIGQMTFIGIDNYKFLISDADFWHSITNTLYIWLLSTIPMLFLALIIAFLLNSAFLRFRTGYRILYFLPNITSIVAVAIVFGTLYSENYGFLNFILHSLGLDEIKWISSPFWVKVTIASMVIWRWTGYNAIIYLAGLQSIPTDLYEAARIDGASMPQSFFRITIPMLRPIILFTVITSTIGGMQVFTESQVLTGNTSLGGVGHSAMTMVLYLYQQSFFNHLFGYGSAIAWGMFVIILVFSFINWKIIKLSEK
ncbi:cytochrome c biogenesis protein [Paenibacillus marchantiophytorum]|uniref:Cytochrome c biogenesis protein n=1 Tax=Paenibacillus marchantiophytorum TaxID=1619310 RepID=A0ABQ2BV69_9BACL|nr:sugar ABC transporter permease [Paenibacillus marchantiophytorum]GGI46553.1 cytochrome c biogenesis protein [Paenibacillus marchantiophytorum]